jgi:hypothetical protein
VSGSIRIVCRACGQDGYYAFAAADPIAWLCTKGENRWVQIDEPPDPRVSATPLYDHAAPPKDAEPVRRKL